MTDYITNLIAPIIFIGSPVYTTIGLILFERHSRHGVEQ